MPQTVRRKLRGTAWKVGRARQFKARLGAARRRAGVPSVYKFKEPYAAGALVVPATTSTGGIIKTNVTGLANFGAYANLFDLYRITGMKVTFLPKFNSAEVPFNGALPVLHIAPNRDPLVPAPAALLDVLNDDGYKSMILDRKRSLYLKYPKTMVLDSQGHTVPFMLNNRSQPWLSTGGGGQSIDQSTLDHVGYRWWMDNTGAYTQSIDIFITLYVQFKERD